MDEAVSQANPNAPPPLDAPECATTSPPEPRWPAFAAFLGVWCRPDTTARRTEHVSLKSAWLVHFMAALGTWALILFFIACAEASELGTMDIGSIIAGMLVMIYNAVCDLAIEFDRHPYLTCGVACAVVCAIELAFLIVSFLAMPWGARDEPIRDSYRHALKRTWLLTAHFLPIVVWIGIPMTALTVAEQHHGKQHSLTRPTWPIPPQNVAADSPEWEAFNKASAETSAAWTRWYDRRPWFVKYQQSLLTPFFLIAAAWLLWGWLRSLGAYRATSPLARPPLCEACGYNLSTIPMDSRCPECGELVIESLGPNVRPGTPWHRREEIGWPLAWWRCCRDGIVQPRALGRTFPLTSDPSAHRSFFAVTMSAIYVVAVLALMAVFFISYPGSFNDQLDAFFEYGVLMSCMVAGFAGVCTLGIMLFAAIVIGLVQGRREKRNLLIGAMPIACYLSGYLLLTVCFCSVTGVAASALAEADVFDSLAMRFGMQGETLAFFIWTLLTFACVIGYFVLVARGTTGTRYANR